MGFRPTFAATLISGAGTVVACTGPADVTSAPLTFEVEPTYWATTPYEECVCDLASWCHGTTADGDCPPPQAQACATPSIDELMDGYPNGPFWPPSLGQCDSPSNGPLTIVTWPDPYGGVWWAFDASGALVSHGTCTDVNQYCSGASWCITYGAPSDDWVDCCTLENPQGAYTWPPCRS